MPKKFYADSFANYTRPAAPADEAPCCPVVDGQATPALFGDVPDELMLEACKERFCPSCPMLKEAEDIKLRALADMDNTRKRLAREKEEHSRYAAESVLSDILPALDNLDLALSHAPQDPASKNFVIGVEMTRKLLLDSLSRHGLTTVGELGEEFDPAVHEAVNMEAHSEYPEGSVCGLMTRGYRLKDRLLRPARVAVCKL